MNTNRKYHKEFMYLHRLL